MRTATPAPVKVESQKLADGVWLLGGGTHNSLLVEFNDFVAVVEAPQNEARSLAVIAEANRLVPNKLVRYLVNTHHHMDHAGGLRTYLSQGTTIVTHESNKQYYLDIMFYPAPRTLDQDRLAIFSPMYMISRRPAPIDTVGGDTRGEGKYVITDGTAMMEIFHVQDLAYELGDPSLSPGQSQRGHADGLSAQGKNSGERGSILTAADGWHSRPAHIAMRTLYQNMQKLKLDVPAHTFHSRARRNQR